MSRLVHGADLGANFSGGDGTASQEFFGSIDFAVNEGDVDFGSFRRDPRKDWSASLDYAHLYSNTAAVESRTDQFTAGISHVYALDTWEYHVNVSNWKDSLNALSYIGPSVGAIYTWREGHGDYKEDVMTIAVNCDAYIYTVDVPISSSTIRAKGGRERGRFIVLPPGVTDLHDTQFHPSIRVDVPLFDELVTPFADAGHYFYTQDPDAIEEISGRPRFSGAAGALGSLTGGFLENSGEIGFSAFIPADITLTASVAANQLATDDSWNPAYEISMTRKFFEHIKFKGQWSRAVEAGVISDLYTGGVSYLF